MVSDALVCMMNRLAIPTSYSLISSTCCTRCLVITWQPLEKAGRRTFFCAQDVVIPSEMDASALTFVRNACDSCFRDFQAVLERTDRQASASIRLLFLGHWCRGWLDTQAHDKPPL
eukprot:scaffold630_cov350-Pavlova_lutheri.AAC.17